MVDPLSLGSVEEPTVSALTAEQESDWSAVELRLILARSAAGDRLG